MKHLKIQYVHNIFGNYWIVRNTKNILLGTIGWRPTWKEMTWRQSDKAEMSTSCLRDLVDAMARREKKVRHENG